MSKNEKKVKSSCFVTKVDLSLAEKLKQDLVNFGFELSKPAYTLFSAKKKGVSVSLYESGKLMVQGKEMAEFIEFYLEPEVLKNFTFTNPEEYADTSPHIGCDEAGKGDFFGPLCIAGVYANTDQIKALIKLGLKDTKKISDKKTLDMAKEIKEMVPYHVIKIGPAKYNELYSKFKNLNSLLAWSHSAVVDQLVTKTGCKQVLIDKFASDSLIRSAVHKKNKHVQLELRTHAEEDVVVAAAAILARATFLYALKDFTEDLGFEVPKGASKMTQEIAVKIVKQFGVEKLKQLCKTHFQTFEQVLAKC